MGIVISKSKPSKEYIFAITASIILGVTSVYFSRPLMLLALGLGLVYLLRNKSEWILSAVIIGTLIFSDENIQKIGIPAIGLNLLDFLMMPLSFIVFYNFIKNKEIKFNVTSFCITVLFLLGSFGILLGVQNGFGIRGALRDYRTFVYLLLIFWVIYLDFNDKRKIWFLIFALFVFVFVELFLVATRKLVLNPAMAKQKIFIIGAGAHLNVWHFLAEYSFFPLLISVALLKNSYEFLSKRTKLFYIFTSIILFSVLILSFNRALYTTISLALLWLLTKDIRKRGSFKRVFYIVLSVIFISIFLIQLAKLYKVEGFSGKLLDRVLYIKDLSEVSVQGRFIDAYLTFEEVIKNPFIGYGLGPKFSQSFLSSQYTKFDYSGTGMHMGYLWLAYRVGIIGLLLFLLIVWNTFKRGSKFLKFCQENSLDKGLMLGLQSCLILISLQAFFSTNLVYFKELPYWGIVIGLIYSLSRITAQQKQL